MILLLPLLVSLVGMLMYALSSNGKLQEIGRLAYAVGLLAFLLQAGPHVVSLLQTGR